LQSAIWERCLDDSYRVREGPPRYLPAEPPRHQRATFEMDPDGVGAVRLQLPERSRGREYAAEQSPDDRAGPHAAEAAPPALGTASART
jgi:hypothetical protein